MLDKFICSLVGHNWYYAEGSSKGVIGGNIRRLCLRRKCKRCHKKEEIDRYIDCFKSKDGDYYFGKPDWINSEK